jgi:hypothetical protein
MWHFLAAMPLSLPQPALFYVALFLACLTGVCALVVIGDELQRVYFDWRERCDSFRNEPAAPIGLIRLPDFPPTFWRLLFRLLPNPHP